MNCTKCGADNKEDALFCKKCGTNLKDKENLISRMNNKINVLAVFTGLIISVLVLFVGAVFFAAIIKSGTFSLPLYLLVVLLIMAFLGSILTGLLGSKNVYEGYINGGFLSLVILVLTGFIAGIIFLAAMGLLSALSSAFGSGASSGAISSLNSTTTSATGGNILDGLIILVEFIVSIILIFIAGIMGGAFGYYIKYGIKKILA